MAWLKIDDRVRTHPKIVEAGPAASWVWFCGICYCREHLTDGFIADKMLPTLVPGMSSLKKAAAVLVTAGLWHRVERGYAVHDFLQWNPSKAEVEAQRAADRDRKGGGVRSDSHRNPSGTPMDSSASRDAHGGLAPPSGSALVVSGSSEESPRETTAVMVPARDSVASRAAALGIVKPGAWERQHASHAFRGDFCGWVCLPESVVEGFAGRSIGALGSGLDARVEVHRWALEVKARWIASGDVPGDDIFEFWRNEWKATHGSNKPATSLAFADPLAGLREAERRG